jgi:hypothetical protein
MPLTKRRVAARSSSIHRATSQPGALLAQSRARGPDSARPECLGAGRPNLLFLTSSIDASAVALLTSPRTPASLHAMAGS